MIRSKLVVLFFALIGFSHFAHATVTECSSISSNSLDYSDAPAGVNGYGVACHDTKEWQKLGSEWTEDSGSDAVGHDDASDDGVTWSTSSDDGANWSEFSATQEITEGDKVKFKFVMARSDTGEGHTYDAVKSWADWDGASGDQTWDADEVLVDDIWMKNEAADGSSDTTSGNYNPLLGTDNGQAGTKEFFSGAIDLEALGVGIGDYWLRARVVCSESIVNWGHGEIPATGYLLQGEVEDYKLTVVAKTKPPTEVPEPATLFVFSLGLFGLGLHRKKCHKVK